MGNKKLCHSRGRYNAVPVAWKQGSQVVGQQGSNVRGQQGSIKFMWIRPSVIISVEITLKALKSGLLRLQVRSLDWIESLGVR